MIRLGRVEITGGFLILVAWLNYLDCSLLIPMAILACTAHELGHYFVIRLLIGNIKVMRLTVIGAEMVLEHPLGYWQEGLAALAGPGSNLLLALLSCYWQRNMAFTGLNLALALFNLLPVGRLDGGRALYCTLAMLTGPNLAERVGKYLDCLFTFTILIAGIWTGILGNFTLFLVALWLLIALVRQNNCR